MRTVDRRNRDLYTVGALSLEPAAIHGVGLVVIARKDDAGDRQLATRAPVRRRC